MANLYPSSISNHPDIPESEKGILLRGQGNIQGESFIE